MVSNEDCQLAHVSKHRPTGGIHTGKWKKCWGSTILSCFFNDFQSYISKKAKHVDAKKHQQSIHPTWFETVAVRLVQNSLSNNLPFKFLGDYWTIFGWWFRNEHHGTHKSCRTLLAVLRVKEFSGQCGFFCQMSTSLRSNQWSCSELAKGAQVCAEMANMDLAVDPTTLSEADLLKTIEDLSWGSCCIGAEFRTLHKKNVLINSRFNSVFIPLLSFYPPGSQEDLANWRSNCNSDLVQWDNCSQNRISSTVILSFYIYQSPLVDRLLPNKCQPASNLNWGQWIFGSQARAARGCRQYADTSSRIAVAFDVKGMAVFGVIAFKVQI